MAISERTAWKENCVLISPEFRAEVDRQSKKVSYTFMTAIRVQYAAQQAVNYVDKVLRAMISQPKD